LRIATHTFLVASVLVASSGLSEDDCPLNSVQRQRSSAG
jgi:hypothetical protein